MLVTPWCQSMGSNTLGNALTLRTQFGLGIPCIMKEWRFETRLESIFSASLFPLPPHQYIQPVTLNDPVDWSQHRKVPVRAMPGGSVPAGHAEHPFPAYRLLDSVLRSSWGESAPSPPLEKGRLPWQRPLRERGVGWKNSVWETQAGKIQISIQHLPLFPNTKWLGFGTLVHGKQ